jgi:hypothetical protein
VDTEQTVRDEVRHEEVDIKEVHEDEKFVKDEGIVAKDLS